ncbi:unnamed protein product, partial [Mesorhabditis spiculigera]
MVLFTGQIILLHRIGHEEKIVLQSWDQTEEKLHALKKPFVPAPRPTFAGILMGDNNVLHGLDGSHWEDAVTNAVAQIEQLHKIPTKEELDEACF